MKKLLSLSLTCALLTACTTQPTEYTPSGSAYPEGHWVSNGQYTAWVSQVDYEQNPSILLTVETEDGTTIELALDPTVTGGLELELYGATLAALGHVNPSTELYQEFDLETGEELGTYAGFSFLREGDDLFYIQGPPHFSGRVGPYEVVDRDGQVLYTSQENLVLRDLKLGEEGLTVWEYDPNTLEGKEVHLA